MEQKKRDKKNVSGSALFSISCKSVVRMICVSLSDNDGQRAGPTFALQKWTVHFVAPLPFSPHNLEYWRLFRSARNLYDVRYWRVRIGSNNSLRLGQRKETASRIKRKAAEWKMNCLDLRPSRKSSSLMLDIKQSIFGENIVILYY